jgi:hypothetical protein
MKALTAALGAVVICACSGSVSMTTASPTPTLSQAETPAANLRVHADLLLGEHTFAVAKLAIAAAAGRKDEYDSYARLLALDGGDLETLLRSAVGETAGAQFGTAWSRLNNSLVDYIVASVTHDQKAQAAAASSLTGTSVPQIASALQSGTSMPSDQATQLAGDVVTSLKLVIDDAAGGAFSKVYDDVAAAHAHAVAIADAVVTLVALEFQDRFPGDPKDKAAEFRASMNSRLQEQAYLVTMATDAVIAGTPADVRGAFATLATNAQALSSSFGAVFGDAAGARFASMWTQVASSMGSYAKSGDPAVRQGVASRAAPEVGDAIQALLTVIDDQRVKSYLKLATDDRAAAGAMAAAGDAISAESHL